MVANTRVGSFVVSHSRWPARREVLWWQVPCVEQDLLSSGVQHVILLSLSISWLPLLLNSLRLLEITSEA